ncbi:hypothetical protein Acr_00g0100570 [Actinidia rufa]|uniref:Uncharacterized protein n=1 Tax=Actinidia rufa TaxID=165716 RepID=A0A7J0E0I2_9ERIC|nr:hypothetical protein Acr_00g0100570 [Actinidia rufa]
MPSVRLGVTLRLIEIRISSLEQSMQLMLLGQQYMHLDVAMVENSRLDGYDGDEFVGDIPEHDDPTNDA